MDWIRGYLKYVDQTEPPDLFKLWTAISTIAACLQRKCWLDWKLERIYPNLYVVLCGPPGSRKGTAMRPARYFLESLGIPMSVEATTREALIRKLSNTTISDPELEALGLPAMHSSLTIFSEELTVFLGQNNWQLMSDLNNWFDTSDKWTYETVGRGENTILGVWVNLLGATTPEFIESALPQDAIGGGLTSRILFIYGDRKSKVVSSPDITEEERVLQEMLLEELDKIQLLKGEFKFTREYFQLYDSWYTAHNEHPPFEDRNFLGYNDRKALHLRKISMVLAASRSRDLLLEGEDFKRAMTILTETEKYMHFSFSARGRASHAWLIEQLIRRIATFKKVPMHVLYKDYYKDATKDEIDAVVGHLESARIVKREFDVDNGTVYVYYVR